MRWRYRAIAPDGRRVGGELDVESHASAVRTLAATGHVVLALQVTRHGGGPRRTRLGQQAAFMGELADLLGARLPLDDALGVIAGSGATPRVRATAAVARRRVREGAGVAEAFGEAEPSLSTFALGILRAGERQSDLAGAAARLASTLARRAAIRSAVMGALAYPSALLAVTLGSLVFVLLVAVPNLAPLLETAGEARPLSARLLVLASDMLRTAGPWLLAAALMLAVAALWIARRPVGRAAFERLLLRLPWVGTTTRTVEAANALRTTAALLASGAPLPEALLTAAAGAGTQHFRTKLDEVAAAVRAGVDVDRAFASAGCFPPAAASLAAVGTRTGKLAEAVLAAADRLERELETRVQRLLLLLPPLLTVGLGLVVGGVVLTVLSAIMQANEVVL